MCLVLVNFNEESKNKLNFINSNDWGLTIRLRIDMSAFYIDKISNYSTQSKIYNGFVYFNLGLVGNSSLNRHRHQPADIFMCKFARNCNLSTTFTSVLMNMQVDEFYFFGVWTYGM